MKAATGSSPQVGVRDGVSRLYDWLRDHTPKPPAAHRGRRLPGAAAWEDANGSGNGNGNGNGKGVGGGTGGRRERRTGKKEAL